MLAWGGGGGGGCPLPAAPPLTPTSPQGPGPPGPLGHLGPLRPGVVLRAHVGDGRESGVLGPTGSGSSCPVPPSPKPPRCPRPRQVIKKTRFPHWDEVLELELAEGEPGEAVLSVEVWDWDMVGKNDFLGRGATGCPAPDGAAGGGQGPAPPLLPAPYPAPHRAHPLPRPGGCCRLGGSRGPPRRGDLAVPTLPSPQPPAGTALAILEEVTSGESRQDVATKLVKIFLGQGLAVPLLDYLTTRELARTTDPNTLFRSNSLASKSVEQFMKVVGLPYLHEVLKPVVNRIFEEKKYVELDPGKMELSRSRRISFKGSLSEARVRESSLELLQGYLGDIVDAIVGSVEKCPTLMRVAFKQLRRRVEERFPSAQHEEVRYFSISGFLFLRFFAPAVLTPKLFSLREQHADPRTGRTLLLLAKALQSIGNLGLQLGQGKEPWMAPLHAVLLPSVTRVKAFLDGLVEVESAEAGEGQVPPALLHPSATIKEGYLHTRTAGGATLLPRLAFKKRYFWLSAETLTYSKSPEWQARCSIPVRRMRAVERVDEGTFQHPHVMQIVAQDGAGQLHTTYIQCKSAQELWQWLWALRQASSANEAMLPTCHPGTFRAGRWTCCLQPACSAPGCSRTHSTVALGEWSDPLDPAAAAQTLYGHLRRVGTRLRAAGAGGPEGSAETEPPGVGQAEGRLQAVLRDLDIAHDAFARQDGPPSPPEPPIPPPAPST
uniref:RAS protein activator like 1 n=1 Tax=Calidris pygmaea TaxID=425635 RepID=A0A8C3KAN0_9CHAR